MKTLNDKNVAINAAKIPARTSRFIIVDKNILGSFTISSKIKPKLTGR